MKNIDTKKKTLMAFRTMAPMLLLCVWMLPDLLSAQTHYAQVLKDVEANNPVLLAAQKVMSKQGSMKLVGVSDAINEIFEVTGFSDILNIE